MGESIESDLVGVRGIENTTPEFRAELRAVAGRLGVEARDLARVMAFESGGSFSPSKRNAAGSGAVGLIQFMPDTARDLGTTTAALSSLTAVEQLAWVEKYFRPYRSKLNSFHDLYMAVLFPKAAGRGEDFVLFSGGKAYRQNAGLDIDKDGRVTAGEASRRMASQSLGPGATSSERADGARPRSARQPRRSGAARVPRRADEDLVAVSGPDVVVVPPAARRDRVIAPSGSAEPERAPAPEITAERATPPAIDLGSAFLGLFAVAAEHYKVTNPALAARYGRVAAALESSIGVDEGTAASRLVASFVRPSADASRALAPDMD